VYCCGGLELKAGKVPALLHTDAQFSCIRSDVLRYLHQRGEDSTLLPYSLTCLLADGKKVQVVNAVTLRVRLLGFSWGYEFKVLDEGPFLAILGLDFLRHTRMGVDLCSMVYGFAFNPRVVGSLSSKLVGGEELFLQYLCGEVVNFTTITQTYRNDLDRAVLMDEFATFFTASLGTAKCTPMLMNCRMLRTANATLPVSAP
jgi:hypothetical protein